MKKAEARSAQATPPSRPSNRPQLHCIGSTERLPTRANRRFIESQSAKDAAFARNFGASMGEPPHSYLTRWRMGIAAQLLEETRPATQRDRAARRLSIGVFVQPRFQASSWSLANSVPPRNAEPFEAVTDMRLLAGFERSIKQRRAGLAALAERSFAPASGGGYTLKFDRRQRAQP